MLIFERKAYQKIMIGDDVVVSVVEVRGDKVRIGIDAPKEIAIDREEVRKDVEIHGRRKGSDG